MRKFPNILGSPLPPSLFSSLPSLSLYFSLPGNEVRPTVSRPFYIPVRSISNRHHFLLRCNSNESLRLNLNDLPSRPGSRYIHELRREETIESSSRIDGKRNSCGWPRGKCLKQV